VLTVHPISSPPADHTLAVCPTGFPAKRVTAAVSYSPPSILRVGLLPTEGGEVTILGENLGSAEDVDAGALSVTFDGVPAPAVELSQDHKKLKCVAPPGVGVARVRVEVAGLGADAEALRAAPEVLALDPPDLDVGGGVLVLSGLNFGDDVAAISVLLPDVGGAALSVDLLEPHRRVRALMPPMPSGVEPGTPVRLRVVVAGLHAAIPTDLVFCPPGGVPATATRPAYVSRRLVAPHSGRGATPLTTLFTAALPNEPALPPRLASPGGARGAKKATAEATTSPIVVGSLSGSGPSLGVTPQSKWMPDTPACGLCEAEFNLSRRRHHCRVCGVCACAACSPHELRLSASAPPVRVCSRCNTRVGLLARMTAVLDSIEALKKELGRDSDLYAFFKQEVVASVAASEPSRAAAKKRAPASAAKPAAGGAAATPASAAKPSAASTSAAKAAAATPASATKAAATTPASAVKPPAAAPASASAASAAPATPSRAKALFAAAGADTPK
jgi:hypothetical protein